MSLLARTPEERLPHGAGAGQPTGGDDHAHEWSVDARVLGAVDRDARTWSRCTRACTRDVPVLRGDADRAPHGALLMPAALA